MDESFAAGQRAWATSAASALVKMTARLKASDTELGRSVRHLDELNERIQDLYQQTMDEAGAMFKNNPAFRQGMEAMSVAGVALMKDMAPLMKGQRELAGVTKRQQELASRLNGLAKRCPTARGRGVRGKRKGAHGHYKGTERAFHQNLPCNERARPR